MVGKKPSSKEPKIFPPMIRHCASLEKSWVRDEASATSENDAAAGKEHIKLGWSQSIFSNACLSCVQGLSCAAMASEPGAAKLEHQAPKAKKRRRPTAVIFLNTRFTEVIIALCL